jgi:hypothetical protein
VEAAMCSLKYTTPRRRSRRSKWGGKGLVAIIVRAIQAISLSLARVPVLLPVLLSVGMLGIMVGLDSQYARGWGPKLDVGGSYRRLRFFFVLTYISPSLP